jgi:hypothetical protein
VVVFELGNTDFVRREEFVVTQEEIKGENSQEVAAKYCGHLWTKALKLTTGYSAGSSLQTALRQLRRRKAMITCGGAGDPKQVKP